MDNLKLNKIVRFDGGQTIKDDDECEKSDEDSSGELQPHFNKFQSLLTEDNSDKSNLATESENDDISTKDSDYNSDKQTTQKVASKAKTNRNRRRKSKKKSTKNTIEGSDDIDFCSVDKQTSNQVASKVNKSSSSRDLLQTLKIDLRNFSPEAEIKKMFGKGILKDERSRDMGSNKGRYRASSQRSRIVPSHNPEILKYQIGHYPKMDLDDHFNRKSKTNDSTHHELYFKYVHDEPYQKTHSQFLSAVNHGISELIVQNFHTNPTHVESIVKLSDMMKISENYKDASQLIERALLILERGFHPKFNITGANCRLSYRRPENRTLFITLFKHINCLNRRGLRRTPLEFTKFLISLDPDSDPLFAILMLDYYAIRSEEYDYLIDFISKWDHFSKLPSFKFSLALAYYMKSRNSKLGDTACRENLEKAQQYLQRALLIYPNFIVQLLDACSAEPEGVKKCDYFNYTIFGTRYRTVPEAVDLLVSLYVKRTFPLWKVRHVMEWLENIVANMVEKFSKGELVDERLNIECWSRFQGPVPRNLLRYVILSDLEVALPQSVSGVTNFDIDPFPPEPLVSYTVSSSNPLPNLPSSSIGLFLRSMMPSFIQNSSQGEQSNDPDRDALEAELNNQIEHILERNQDEPVDIDVLQSLANLVMGDIYPANQERHDDEEPRGSR